MLQITKRADYAVRLVMEVAASSGEVVTTAQVSKRQGIPYQFLRKVAQSLTTSGLLVSERGGNGGLSLSRPANQVSVLDVLQSLDTPELNDCSVNPENCKRRSVCAAFPVWFEAQAEMERVLGRTPMSRLAKAHRAIQERLPLVEASQMARGKGDESPPAASRTAPENGNKNRLESERNGLYQGGGSHA